MKNQAQLTKKASPKEIAAFAVYGGGNGIFNYMLNSFGSYFYTNVVGINSLVTGIFMTVCKIIDFFTDLIMGTLIDKTKSKSGEKARPWLKRAMIPGSLGLILMFSAPFTTERASLIWAIATYFLATSIGFTMNIIPYQAMMPLISGERVSRSKLEASYGIIAMVISLVAGICVEPMAGALGGGRKGWFLTACILSVVALALHLVGYLGTKEHIRIEQPMQEKRELKDVIKELGYLFKNKYWVLVAIFSAVNSLSTMGASMMYYVQYVMGDFSVLAYVMIVMMLPPMVMLAIAPVIVSKFGKVAVVRIGSVVMILGAVIVWFFSSSISFYLGVVLLAFGNGGATATMISFIGDSIDYGEYKFGVRTDGIGISLNVSLQKIAQACATLILGGILTIGGYDPQEMVQSASSIMAIKVCFCGVPMMIAIVLFIISIFLNVEKKYPDLSELLEKKRMENRA